MKDKTPLKFGTLEVTTAAVTAGATCLQLSIGDGALNKRELGMFIQFLQAKQEELGAS